MEHAPTRAADAYPFDMGSYSRPVRTGSAEAQRWFDRGLAWCYGFNHDEAIRCFERAARADPDCAMAHWGVAYAALGEVAAAEAEQRAFRAAVEGVPESRTVFNNTCRAILGVAEAMLDGELTSRKGAHDEAFAKLRRAAELSDDLTYDEPWGWMQPVRHALGALLLEQGRVEEALEVYRDDLGLSGRLPRAVQHPDNVWALTGLVECLDRLGRSHEAEPFRQRLALARARADVDIAASCFCRLDTSGAHAAHDHGGHGGHAGHCH